MLDIITRTSTINIQEGYDHCLRFFGFLTSVSNPVESKSMYNAEDADFDYPDNPDFSLEIVYANYMDLTRLESSSLMDSYSLEPMGYTRDTNIETKARLTVPFQGKKYEFTVKEINVLEFDDIVNGEAIRRLVLEPYN